MPTDPLSRLQAAIAASARERDQKDQKIREEQLAKERQREQAKAIWDERKMALPGIVKVIDAMLKEHGYAGMAMGNFDLKHTDIDRAVIEFAHNARTHSKLLLCVTRAGEFTCSVTTAAGDTGATRLPIAELTEDRLKEALAHAVVECLGGERSAYQRAAETTR